MPEATPINTLISSSFVKGLLSPAEADGDGELTIVMRRRPAERKLLLACEAASARGETVRLLTQAVAAMPSNSLRREASRAFLDQLQVDWMVRLARVATIPAEGPRGLTAKATLLAQMITRDEADCVQGPPVLRIAASVADDILVLSED